MPSKSGPTGYRPAEGSRNPYDYPHGRVPNHFDGLTVEQVCAEVDARITKVFKAKFEPVIKAAFAEYDEIVSKRIEKALEHSLRWKGAHTDTETYQRNDLVQARGTLYVATVEKATTKPGTSAEWRQLIKTKGSASDDD